MPGAVIINPISIGDISAATTISPGNSTSTPLGAGATFPGSFESVLGASTVTLIVFTDQDSASDGLVMEWSSDGVNIDETDKFSLEANKGKQFSFGVPAQYLRVTYTNNATTAQTVFRMQVIYHPFKVKSSSHRLIDTLNDNDDAELVKAIIAAKNANGVYKNLSSDALDRLLVSGSFYLSEPEPPPDSDKVTIDASSPIDVSGSETYEYTITNGKTFTLAAATIGAEGDPTEKGSKVEISYVDSGGTPHLIERVYITGFTVQIFPGTNEARDGTVMVGNGTTTKIRIVRFRFGGSTAEIDAIARGYEI